MLCVYQRITENNDIITDFQTDKLMEFDVSSMELVGYFTIALKPLTVRGETVSNTDSEEPHELVQLLRLL